MEQSPSDSRDNRDSHDIFSVGLCPHNNQNVIYILKGGLIAIINPAEIVFRGKTRENKRTLKDIGAIYTQGGWKLPLTNGIAAVASQLESLRRGSESRIQPPRV